MTRSFVRLLVVAFLGSGLLPLVTVVCTRLNAKLAATPIFVLKVGCASLAVLLATAGFYTLLRRFTPQLDANGREQAQFLSELPPRYVSLAIVGAAALSLLLELAVIRWQGTVFEFFAYYKNFTLLCCFAGLGLGYAVAGRDRVFLGLVVPLLAWQFALLIGLRFWLVPLHLESLTLLPFTEQLNMGIRNVRSLSQAGAVYSLLALVFLLTVLALIPIGQLCGRLMERREKLPAYGLNLLGSLAGVVLMLGLSSLWTPPLVWFAIAFIGMLVFYLRRPPALLLGIASVAVALIVLAWPVNPFWQRIYSPYQLLEVGYSAWGLMQLRVAGHYYQKVHDLARSNRNVDADSVLRSIRDYYELPYRIYGKPGNVAIVGAGTGNDVAAALRAGADSVDAIEIDPAILDAGRANHPERPYDDKRVRAIVNDARSYLRTTEKTYDMVVYGLLDSHTLLSHASSVRLDSFVYTVQALREARTRLRPGGVLSLSFSVLSDQLGRKIYLMMQQAFDGRVPVCVKAGYDGSVIFLEAKDKDLVLPMQLLQETGFNDKTAFYGNHNLRADVSTDDWPFFYMPNRVYPLSYLGMVVLLLALSLMVSLNFFDEKPKFSHVPFFLLGAGFMLVETKGITELGLTFGNSWQVIGIVISGILAMAFLANCVVRWLGVQRPLIPYLLLLLSLGFGWIIARTGGLPSTPMGRFATAVVLTCPIFFSGIVFSTLVASRGTMSAIMAVNLLGAMLGGLLEYNSMYFGFQFLYLIAMILYALAFAWELPGLEAGVTHLASAPLPGS
jgi:spermidine synthase